MNPDIYNQFIKNNPIRPTIFLPALIVWLVFSFAPTVFDGTDKDDAVIEKEEPEKDIIKLSENKQDLDFPGASFRL
jgi:hypothetical protein